MVCEIEMVSTAEALLFESAEPGDPSCYTNRFFCGLTLPAIMGGAARPRPIPLAGCPDR